MRYTRILIAALLACSCAVHAQENKERVAAVKASLTASQALLKKYEWIETTTVSVKGEEKSRTINRCYYGDDGKLQKVPVVAPPPKEKPRGIRGKIVEQKKEELTEYMHEAVALVKSYFPPEPARIHVVQEAGKLTIQPLPGGAVVRLTLGDYLKARDSLALDIDAKRNQLRAARVASYIASDKEAVTMMADFATLQDAIVYPARITLNAEGKKLSVVVENSGHRKVGDR
jgi:hypothetical protein